MTPTDIKEAVKYLLDNPDKSLGSTFHDAGSCWKLIDELVTQLREAKEDIDDLREQVILYQENED